MQTQAKRKYNQILSELLTKGDSEELAEKLEILRLFLESVDFTRLRSDSEKHLVEGRKVKFILYQEKGILKYEMKIA